MEKEYPKYEEISYAERTERDPSGRHPVTLLKDSVIIRTDQFPAKKESESMENTDVSADELEQSFQSEAPIPMATQEVIEDLAERLKEVMEENKPQEENNG